MSGLDSSRKALLQVYKQLLRSAKTYPSSNRTRIYQAIREEWRENASMGPDEAQVKVSLAYKGLGQLRQFDVSTMTAGNPNNSNNWNVQLEQNPMPKPADYDERKKSRRR